MNTKIGFALVGAVGLVALPLVPAGGQKAAPPPWWAGPYVPPKGYVCYRASAPLQIDGRLEDGPWRDAPWTDDFVDIEGDRKPRPRFRTHAKMLWDDTYFYVAALLEELIKLDAFFRKQVGKGKNRAVSAHRQARINHRCAAGEHLEVLRRASHDFANPLKASGAVFDANDVGCAASVKISCVSRVILVKIGTE